MAFALLTLTGTAQGNAPFFSQPVGYDGRAFIDHGCDTEKLLRLSPDNIAKPDYNVADKRRLDWDARAARAEAIFEATRPTIP